MNIEKPDTLSCTSQPLDWGGTLYQSFTVGLGFDLRTGKLLPADVAWAGAMQGLAPGDCMDMGLPKKQAEWLLAGKACAPGGVPVVRLSVDVRVGGVSRRLLVAGEQETFVSMPLTWDRTWGDPQNNPLGVEPSTRHRPPVTDAALPFGSPACPGPLGVWPCRMKHMGTYDAAWLQTRWPGVPDDFDWSFFNLAQPCQRLPEGLRGDEEVVLTNLHPEEPALSVRLPGKTLHMSVLRGTEWKENAVNADTLWLFPNQLTGLVLWHALTPCADEIASDISGVRLVLEPPDADTAEAAEVAAEAAAGAGAAVAAVAAVAGVAAAVVGVAAAAGAASSSSAASSSGAGDSDTAAQPADAAQEQTQTVPKTPAEEPTLVVADTTVTAAAYNAQLDESLDEINAALVSAGIPPLTPEQVAETRQHLSKAAEAIQTMQAKMEEPQPQLEELLRQAGVSEERIKAVNTVLELEQPNPADFSDAAAWNAAVDAYTASFNALLQPSEEVLNMTRTVMRLKGPGSDELLKELAGAQEEASPEELLVQGGVEPAVAARLMAMLESDDIPTELSELSAYAHKMEQELGFPPDSVSGTIERLQAALEEAGLYEKPAVPASVPEAQEEPSAPVQTPESEQEAPEPVTASGRETPADRSGVLLLLAAGGSLAGLALAGMNLSGLDLSGQDMASTGLAGASLAGSRLNGANLAGANLAGADLTGASFVEADLSGADLTGAQAPQATFIKTRFDGANLSGLTAPEADCTEASLVGTNLSASNFSGANFSGISGDGLNAAKADLSGARLRFCSLHNAVFDDARLGKADFHEAALDGAGFRGADLREATFCGGTRVPQGLFLGALLAGSVWTGVAAPGCVFTGGKAAGGRFTDCDFSGSAWRGADVRGGDFSRCQLQGADMQGINLFRGSLREAQAAGTDLRGANLYGADLYRFGMDADTRLSGADCTHTVLAARKEV